MIVLKDNMIGGLTESEYQFVLDTIQKPLVQNGATLWLFGSRARGTHSTFADVDLLIEGELNQSLLGELREKIEQSNFPFKVDLVLDAELADSYRANVYKDKKRFI